MRRTAVALIALVVAMALVPLVASAVNAEGLDGLVTGEAESYALRVEYDIPLPAGAGDIPHTVGEIRRTSAGENAKGVAGAPTHLGAVVAGQYINPNHEITDPADYNMPPQAECFYPGALVDVVFGFPTDTRKETKPLPPISKATAQCSAGPQSRLSGTVDYFEATGITARNVESTSWMRTAEGADRSDTSAHAHDISLAGGAVKIGGVAVSSASSVTGKKAGASTATRLTIDDVEVAGLTFSIADDRLIVAGESVPLAGNVAQGIVDQANTFLVGSGCRIDVIDNPGRYPQGYLFARPDPRVGVADDGSFAGSMRAGLLVVCDLPESVTPDNLTPQRIQAVIGFAYSAASATADPGGFGLGNLTGDNGNAALPALGSFDVALPPLGPAPTANAVDAPAKPRRNVNGAAPRVIAVTPLAGATRLTLLLLCGVAWALLTHLGITRLRRTA